MVRNLGGSHVIVWPTESMNGIPYTKSNQNYIESRILMIRIDSSKKQ